jgi:hypothetical protein
MTPDGPIPHRRIVLRDERDGADHRHLEAYLDTDGDLHIDGQDLGPATAPVSGDGEYEWFQTIRAEHLPDLLAALGGGAPASEVRAGDLVLDVLADRFTGPGSYDLEAVLRTGPVPVERWVWSG